MRYLTTPIYYVNDEAHLGHAYTTVIADTMARFYRLQGEETLFLTGTDEHGQKIEQAAKARGYTPKEYADEISAKFKALWDEFSISYDIYARTTDERHIKAVQMIFRKMFEKGDIYKGEFKAVFLGSLAHFLSFEFKFGKFKATKCEFCLQEFTFLALKVEFFVKKSEICRKKCEFFIIFRLCMPIRACLSRRLSQKSKA